MNKNFDLLRWTSRLVEIGERQFANETKAARLITTTLREFGVGFHQDFFTTKIPVMKKATLKLDGKPIPVRGTGFVSGEITDKTGLLSSLVDSDEFCSVANINFNPSCSEISPASHYVAPALAVKSTDIAAIIAAQKIKGTLKVVLRTHRSSNILVGNLKNPERIVFCHYDSFGPGATDNASGCAVFLKLIIDSPELLKNNLFVFAGNEELSYDRPVYWGHGYRVFEKKYFSLLRSAKQIIPVDCVGNGKTTVDNNLAIIRLAFPIQNLERWQKKIITLYGDLEKLFAVYHSELDTLETVSEKYLLDAAKVLKKLLEF